MPITTVALLLWMIRNARSLPWWCWGAVAIDLICAYPRISAGVKRVILEF